MNNPMQMIMQMMGGGANPQQIVQSMIQRNPQMNAIVNQARQSGMTMRDYVMNYAKQNNIDINPVINALRSRGVKF